MKNIHISGSGAVSHFHSNDESDLNLPGGVTFVQNGEGSSINIFFGPYYHNSKEDHDKGTSILFIFIVVTYLYILQSMLDGNH